MDVVRRALPCPDLSRLNSDEFAWSSLKLGTVVPVIAFSCLVNLQVQVKSCFCSYLVFSSFKVKQHWLGENYLLGGHDGNEITKTNVPDVRAAFRYETLVDELHVLSLAAREQRASAQKEAEVNGVR